MTHPQDDLRLAEKPSACALEHRTTEFVVRYSVNGFAMAFWVLVPLIEVTEPPRFQLAGATCSPEPTSDVDAAQWLMHGSVKWDGCADVDVGDDRDEAFRLHFCGHHDARRVARAIDLVYELAAGCISTWDSQLPARPSAAT